MASLNLFELYATISIKMDEFEQGIDRAQKKFKSFSDNISGLSGKIDSAYKGMGDVLKPAVDGFKAVEGVGKTAGNAVVKGLGGFAAASTAVAGFGAAAVKSGMQFDATMSEVSAISGATGEEFDALRDKALEMGAKTKFSASEAAAAMTYMAMAGWKTGDMLGGIEGIMNLAAASGEDLATTSDIVTDALTAFGYSAADSTHFADVLAVASSNANTNVGMMGETFKYVAPVAGTLGYSIEDTALAIGLMANSGIKASSAGTALRSIFNRLATDTGASSKSLGALGILTQKLGVEFYNADGSARDFNAVLMESRDAWKELTVQEQENYAKKIAGEEAGSAWMAMMNATNEDVQKLTASIEDCNGASAKMAEIMSDNLQGDIDRLGSAFESLQIAISDSLTPTLREFAQFGQKAMANLLEGFQGGGVSGFMSALSGIVTEGVTMLAEKAPEFASVSVQFVGALADGLLNAGDAIITSGYEVAWTLIGGIREWISANSDELLRLGDELVWHILNGFLGAGDLISENIGKFVPLIANAFTAYHEALFTVGLDILGAIGQGLVENKDEIQRLASLTIENMVTSLRDNAPSIIEGGLALLEALVGAIEENMPLIIETGAVIIGKLVEGIATASPGVQAIIATAVLPHILKIGETATNIGMAFLDVAKVATKALSDINSAISNVVKFAQGGITTILGIGKTLMGGIKSLFALIAANPVVAIITGIIAAVVLLYTKCEWFRDAVHAVIDAVVGFFQGAWDLIVSAWEAAGDFFGGIVDGIKSVFEGIGEFLGGLFTAAWEMVQGAWDAAVEFFTGIGNGIKETFQAVTETISGFFRSAWEAVQGAWSAAKGFFSGIWDAIKSGAKTAADNAGSAFKKGWEAVKSAWDGATTFFSGIWDKIKGVFSDVWSKFKEIGGNIVSGIKDGILGAWDSFIGWIGDKVGGIVTAVKNMLGIHSPSRVFAGIGENMALGLAEGWNDEYAGIKQQIENGLNFGTATVGLSANYSGAARYGAQEAPQRGGTGWGNTYVTINSPKAVDGVQAAREWQKTAQRMALGYV